MKRIVILLIFFSIPKLNATLIGSDLAVLRQSNVNFLVDLITPNEIRGFVKIEDGFSLNSSSVECEFNAFFPVKGDVSLNGGTLNLSQDLILDNPATLDNLGNIIASSPLQLSLATLMASLGSATSTVYTFSNIKLILNSNITLNSFIKFEGDCVIDGNKNVLDLSNTASIIVASNATLTIKDAWLEGIQNTNIRCADDTGIITLEGVDWVQDNDVQFKNGALRFDDVKMTCLNNCVFAYQSSQTSTILNDARLKLDSTITFSYDPIAGEDNLIELASDTSCIELNGATLHVTTTGWQLTNGLIRVKRDSFIATEQLQQGSELIDNGITLGTGTSGDDTTLEILSGTTLSVNSGTLNYKNVLSSSLNLVSERSILCMGSGTIIRLFNNLDLGVGFLKLKGSNRLIRKNSSKVTGALVALGTVKYTEP